MKNKIPIGLFLSISFVLIQFSAFGQPLPKDIVNNRYDDSEQLPKEFSYYKIGDKVIVSFIVTEYSDDIIYYDLTIKALPNKQISQKGYAINPSSRLNGGVEPGVDETGKEISFRPFYTTFCNCDDQLSFNFYITTDKSKVMISSSRQMKSDLFEDKIVLKEGSPKGVIDLFGFIHLLEK